MTNVKEIESAVSQLSREELEAFRTWFEEFDADAWDRQLEEDVTAGRLDSLADEALNDLNEGRRTDLGSTGQHGGFGNLTINSRVMFKN